MNSIDRNFVRLLMLALVGLLPALSSCAADSPAPKVQVVEPVFLEFTGPLNDARAEVSGLTWKDDALVILPQDPILFGQNDMLGFFIIRRNDILEAVAGRRTDPLEPELMDCEAAGMIRVIAGFDGLEAVGMIDERVYLTVEAKEDTVMAGYLLSGQTNKVDGRIVMDMTRLTSIPLGCNIPNVAEESIVIDGNRVITISEANGRNLFAEPRAKVFDENINYLGSIPFPQIEFRVTDATALDEEGRFWVINYFYPPERAKLKPTADPELERFGLPAGYDPDGCVERLLELQLTRDDRIVRTDTPPINLKLTSGQDCRNWEAVVRLGDDGFLLMTDKYPGTLLAYVANPFTAKKEN